jgi:hypothetical protein
MNMMIQARWGVAVAWLGLSTIPLGAQQPPLPGTRTGNPTPGTPQPEPPNPAERITLTGCIEPADNKRAAEGASVGDRDSPSASGYMLTKAARRKVVPEGTGASAAAAKLKSRTYRLNAIDSQLSPFVGTRVEISGEVEPSTPNADNKADAKTPILRVEFVQKVAPMCR